MLRDLTILDLTSQIASVPLHSGYAVLPPRSEREQYITFHYSGVNNPDRSHTAEIVRVMDETFYQVHHDYSSDASGAYPDGYLYDFVVLSDGTICRTRPDRRQLWHAGNATANRRSWSVHVLLGPGQDLTSPQRTSLFALFDALRSESSIPRQNVVAHCEWPRKDGLPQRSTSYRLLPGQSACPGAALFPHVVAYRSVPDAPRQWRTRAATPIYEVPRVDPTRIALSGTAVLPTGAIVQLDATYPTGMGHLDTSLGFVELRLLEPA